MKTQESWAKSFREMRGELTRKEASEILFGCPVGTIRDWEQGLRTPPVWVQYLVGGQMLRAQAKTRY